MKIDDFSSDYQAKALYESDIDTVYLLCGSNELFYRYHPPFVTKESILEDMHALPPNKAFDDKFYFGFFRGEKLVAIMDLILGYPNEQTAFIGLFMVDAKYQGKGVGSHIIKHCVDVIKQAGFDSIRLGIDKGNPQSERFWTKNKFTKTGEVREQEHGTILLMERAIER